MDIHKSNKLIAEFMEIEMFGEEKDHTEAILICSALDLPVNPCTHFENVQETVHLDDMKFDSSWDWLMPVVDKIESLKLGDIVLKDSYGNDDLYSNASVEVKIQHSVCIINLFGTMKVYEQFIDAIEDSKKESTYKAVIKFIEWYNENKN